MRSPISVLLGFLALYSLHAQAEAFKFACAPSGVNDYSIAKLSVEVWTPPDWYNPRVTIDITKTSGANQWSETGCSYNKCSSDMTSYWVNGQLTGAGTLSTSSVNLQFEKENGSWTVTLKENSYSLRSVFTCTQSIQHPNPTPFADHPLVDPTNSKPYGMSCTLTNPYAGGLNTYVHMFGGTVGSVKSNGADHPGYVSELEPINPKDFTVYWFEENFGKAEIRLERPFGHMDGTAVSGQWSSWGWKPIDVFGKPVYPGKAICQFSYTDQYSSDKQNPDTFPTHCAVGVSASPQIQAFLKANLPSFKLSLALRGYKLLDAPDAKSYLLSFVNNADRGRAESYGCPSPKVYGAKCSGSAILESPVSTDNERASLYSKASANQVCSDSGEGIDEILDGVCGSLDEIMLGIPACP